MALFMQNLPTLKERVASRVEINSRAELLDELRKIGLSKNQIYFGLEESVNIGRDPNFSDDQIEKSSKNNIQIFK